MLTHITLFSMEKNFIVNKKKKSDPFHKVIILGAGATRGASIFEDVSIKPPVDIDFFSILEKLSTQNKEIKKWITKLREEIGIPLNGISMESVFTKLEALANFLPNIKSNTGPKPTKHTTLLKQYSKQIANCFHQILKGINKADESCIYHEKIVKSLTTKDVIISFNYDCIIDTVLRNCGNRKWDASTGYGFLISQNSGEWHKHEKVKGPHAKQSLHLLKLHGSLNWKLDKTNNITLRKFQHAYEIKDRGDSEIIAPIWNKNILTRKHLSDIWIRARKALQNANDLVVIGYSVPDTDLQSQALLQIDTANAKNKGRLKTLVIVNPDSNARKKLIILLQKAITSKTNILEYNTLKEYAESLKD